MIEALYYLLDVFTDRIYGGNQLAIFPDATEIDEGLFQKIARELNLSETVFLIPPNHETENYSMRIFTPGKELPTAGHPTIGTAYFLAEHVIENKSNSINIVLNQKVGEIPVDIEFRNGKVTKATMTQPAPTFGPIHADLSREIAEMLSLDIAELSDLPIQEVSCGNNTLIVPLRSTEMLSKVVIKTDQWAAIKSKVNDAFLYVFSLDGVSGGDVQGRMFAPEIGIAEDPATGSANGPLISYLVKHDIVNKPIISLQGIEMGRPSKLFLSAQKSSNGMITDVKVGGQAVFTGKGLHFLEMI